MKKHPQLYTMKEAAEQLGYSYSAIYHLAERGEIRVIKGYGRWLVHRKELEKWIREHKIQTPKPLPPEPDGQIPGQLRICQADLEALMGSTLYRVTFADGGEKEKMRYFHCHSAREAAKRMERTRPGCKVLEVDIWDENENVECRTQNAEWRDPNGGGKIGDRERRGGVAGGVPENGVPVEGAGDTPNRRGNKQDHKKLDRRMARGAGRREESRGDDEEVRDD